MGWGTLNIVPVLFFGNMLLLGGSGKSLGEDFIVMAIDRAFEFLLLENHLPGILVIKISRPKALNALNSGVILELKVALEYFAKDPTVRVVVLTGDGEKSFIAGADISEMQKKTRGEGTRFGQNGHEVAKLLETMPKPTIAAVNGFALGGGTEMAIACDFIIASPRAIFGQPEVGLGITPGFGATIRLARFVGWPRAKELVFSGRKIDAREALRMGLVNHIYEAETAADFLAQVITLARLIANQSAGAVAKSKALLNEFSESTGLNFKADAEAQAFGTLFGSHDQIEGMSAFIEKRKPQFEGIING